MSEIVDIRGVAEVQAYLASVDKASNATLQKATSAGARALKPYVQAAAPVQTGRLRKSVSAHQARRQRPAAIVTPRAFYAHMVIGGTKDHGPKKASVMAFEGRNGAVFAHHVRGTKPRPFVDEGFNAGQGAMNAAIDKVIDEALKG